MPPSIYKQIKSIQLTFNEHAKTSFSYECRNGTLFVSVVQ